MGTSHSWSAGERGERAQFNGAVYGIMTNNWFHTPVIAPCVDRQFTRARALSHTYTDTCTAIQGSACSVALATLSHPCSYEKMPMWKKPKHLQSSWHCSFIFFSARCPQGQHCQHSAIVALSFFEDTLFCSIARHSLLYSGFRAISGMDSGRLPLIIAVS